MNAPHPTIPNATTAPWRSRLARARARLAKYPNVVGVGLGLAEGGATAGPAWRVYVSRKLPRDVLAPGGGVPDKLFGLRTDVVVARHGDPAAGPGMIITNDGGGKPGAVGCFAKHNNDVVILSAAHVLFGNTDMVSNPQLGIYSPDYSSCCGGGDKIATTLLSWSDGFRPIRGMNGVFDTDCAIARLVSGMPYSNQIPGIGTITGAGPDPNPGMLLLDFTTKPADQQLVRMFSPLNPGGGVRYGSIIRLVTGAGDPPSPLSLGPFRNWDDQMGPMLPAANQLVILPRPEPVAGETQADYDKRYKGYVNSGRQFTFAEGGDSGSVVVDNVAGSISVIGLLSRRYPASDLRDTFKKANRPIPDSLLVANNLGIVTPISNVLAQMQITIPSGLAGTAPAAGVPLRAFIPPVALAPDLPAVDVAIARLRNNLMTTRRGALMVTTFAEHRAEASRLVNTVRHVTATWIRYEGPAFMHHCVRSLRDPAHAVPAVINGVSFAELLGQMRKMLLRYGSPKLRRDIRRLGGFAIDLLTSVDRVHDLPDSLRQRAREPA